MAGVDWSLHCSHPVPSDVGRSGSCRQWYARNCSVLGVVLGSEWVLPVITPSSSFDIQFGVVGGAIVLS